MHYQGIICYCLLILCCLLLKNSRHLPQLQIIYINYLLVIHPLLLRDLVLTLDVPILVKTDSRIILKCFNHAPHLNLIRNNLVVLQQPLSLLCSPLLPLPLRFGIHRVARCWLLQRAVDVVGVDKGRGFGLEDGVVFNKLYCLVMLVVVYLVFADFKLRPWLRGDWIHLSILFSCPKRRSDEFLIWLQIFVRVILGRWLMLLGCTALNVAAWWRRRIQLSLRQTQTALVLQQGWRIRAEGIGLRVAVAYGDLDAWVSPGVLILDWAEGLVQNHIQITLLALDLLAITGLIFIQALNDDVVVGRLGEGGVARVRDIWLVGLDDRRTGACCGSFGLLYLLCLCIILILSLWRQRSLCPGKCSFWLRLALGVGTDYTLRQTARRICPQPRIILLFLRGATKLGRARRGFRFLAVGELVYVQSVLAVFIITGIFNGTINFVRCLNLCACLSLFWSPSSRGDWLPRFPFYLLFILNLPLLIWNRLHNSLPQRLRYGLRVCHHRAFLRGHFFTKLIFLWFLLIFQHRIRIRYRSPVNSLGPGSLRLRHQRRFVLGSGCKALRAKGRRGTAFSLRSIWDPRTVIWSLGNGFDRWIPSDDRHIATILWLLLFLNSGLGTLQLHLNSLTPPLRSLPTLGSSLLASDIDCDAANNFICHFPPLHYNWLLEIYELIISNWVFCHIDQDLIPYFKPKFNFFWSIN